MTASSRKFSSVLDTRVIYCGDNLEQLKKLPDGTADLIYIDPPFNSNRNYEVFWGETKEKRAFEAAERAGRLARGTTRPPSRAWRRPPGKPDEAGHYLMSGSATALPVKYY